MKRLALFLALVAMMLCCASCAALPLIDASSGDEKQEGQEIIESAMVKYCEQSSGGYEAFDNNTGKLLERFVFSYDEVGFLTFLSEVYNDDGSVYKEYNTGYAVYIEENGIGRKLSKNDKQFVVYNKDISRHTKASDTIFGFVLSGIWKVDKTENEDGSSQYTYIYDPDEAGIQVDGGKLSEYSITYCVDAADEVYEFTQKASGTFDSGDPLDYDYTVKLIPSESVGLIENPITVSDTAEQEAQEE